MNSTNSFLHIITTHSEGNRTALSIENAEDEVLKNRIMLIILHH
jgi:hypothetical protein